MAKKRFSSGAATGSGGLPRTVRALAYAARRSSAGLRAETEGFAVLYFAIAMPALMALSLLAIDVGRGNNLHYDLQKAVDSLALAAAAELDGGPTSITRATSAVNNLLDNQTRFSDLGLTSVDGSDVVLTFLCELPDADDDPMEPTGTCSPLGNTGGNVAKVTTDPRFARFAWVRAQDLGGGNNFAQSMTSVFPALFGAPSSIRIGAEAVAGGPLSGSGSACGVTPVWICNPFELTDLDDPNQIPGLHVFADRDSDYYGRLFSLRPDADNQPLPGDMGFLAVEGQGNNVLRDALASSDPALCINDSDADTEPGFKNSSVWGLNTRFDAYLGDMKNKHDEFPPAQNVRKGYKPTTTGNACNAGTLDTQANGFMPLPDDTGTATDLETGIPGNTAIGDGNWDRTGYWTTNYDHDGDGVPPFPAPPEWGGKPPSRFDMYKYEISTIGGSPDFTQMESIGGEKGAPQCGTPPATGNLDKDAGPLDDRRILSVSVVNCHDFKNNGTKPQGRTVVPIAFYADIFLTRPTETTGSGNADDDVGDKPIRFEVVQVSGGDGGGDLGGNLRPEVVLYR